MALPQNILDDVADLEAKLGQLQTDQAAVPGLQATATAADAALVAGQTAVTTDTAAVDTSFKKLQADIAALENPPHP